MAANTITRTRLRRLADVKPDRGRVLSVFLNLDPTEFATPAARSSAITSVMTEAARRIEAEDLDHAEREGLKADVERVREILGGDVALDGTRAVAVYACQSADLLEVVSLRHPLDSRVVLDRTPYVEPLVSEGAPERWCVLLVNRRVARLFLGDGERLEETDRIEDDVHRQHRRGGWSQSNYQRSVEKEKDDHVLRSADVAFGLYKERGFDRLLLATPDELIGEVKARLHPYLKERLVARVQVDIENSTLEDVTTSSAKKIVEYAKGRERQALDRMIEGIGRGGRGAGGLSDVLAALNDARVETLLLAGGFTAPGRIDSATGMLYTEDGGQGDQAAGDIVERAIEKAIEQSADVIGVKHHDDLGPLGGIGAVLRY